jgi:type I restriction enzyme S subunit
VSAHPSTPLGSCVLRVETWNPLRADPDEEFHYIDLSAVDQDTKSIAEAREIACADAPSRARQLVRTGDVLVSTVRPNLNGVARVPDDLDGATASTGFCVLRPDPEKLSGGYLFHWVKSAAFVGDMVSKATGASYPAVSDRIIFESLFPLPPLEEQRRIAAILDQAETLRTQRRTALALLDSLTQSLFLDMFGDPVANPKGFIKQPLSGVAEITTGSTPGRGSDGYYGGNIPWVKTTEVAGGEIHDTEEKLTEAGLKAIRGKLHPVNSIVVAMYGQGQTRGRCALLRIEASCNQACGVIRPSEEFVPWFMFTQLLLAYERLRALGRGGNQENLNLQLLGSFEVLVPPFPLQQTFATRIASIEALKATHRRALAALDALFASLQQRAFTGVL